MLDLLRLKGTKRNYLSIKIPSFCIITYLEIIRKSQFFLFAWLLIWSTTSDHDQLDDCFSNCIVVRQAHSNFESLEKPDRGSAFLNFRREKKTVKGYKGDVFEMGNWHEDLQAAGVSNCTCGRISSALFAICPILAVNACTDSVVESKQCIIYDTQQNSRSTFIVVFMKYLLYWSHGGF